MATKDRAQEKRRQARRQARKRKERQERRQKRQRWAAAKAVRAEEKPRAEPRAAGHLMERFWHHFQFDKVFGVQSKQLEVYRAVVEPLILQVNTLTMFKTIIMMIYTTKIANHYVLKIQLHVSLNIHYSLIFPKS